jgi:hypothetical protein
MTPGFKKGLYFGRERWHRPTKVDDWWIYPDTVLAVAIGLAVARYSFYLYSPTATPGYAASMRLSIFGGGVGGHASGIPVPETPYDWVQLECLRAFSLWDLAQGPGAAAIGGIGFGASAGASILAGAGRWSFRRTTVPLASQAQA